MMMEYQSKKESIAYEIMALNDEQIQLSDIFPDFPEIDKEYRMRMLKMKQRKKKGEKNAQS